MDFALHSTRPQNVLHYVKSFKMQAFCRMVEALTCWSGTKKEMIAELSVPLFLGEEGRVVLVTNGIARKYSVNPY